MNPSQRKPVYHPVTGHFIGFTGDPGTQAVRGGGTQPALPGRTFTRRARPQSAMSGLGAISRNSGAYAPTPDGVARFFSPAYSEETIWGTGNENDTVVAPIDPSTPVDDEPGPDLFDPGISIPFGVSIIPWRNPTTMQSVPVNAATSIVLPVLSLNMQRNSLLIQNNSTATAPDIAATFWIGFNAQPQVGLSLSLAPGAGLLFDIITPRDSIYVFPAGNVGATSVVQGVVVQGTYAPI
jgi:hypothetical protein